MSKLTPQLNGQFNLLESYDKHSHTFILQRDDHTQYTVWGETETLYVLASFPGSPSYAQIILRMTFDPPERKTEGEPGPKHHVNDVKGREKVERT